MSKQFYFKTIQFSVNTQLNVKTVLFQVIMLSISTQFSSIKPIERDLSGAATPDQSGPWSDGNDEVRIALHLCLS